MSTQQDDDGLIVALSEIFLVISMAIVWIIYWWKITIIIYLFGVMLTLGSDKALKEKFTWIFTPPTVLLLAYFVLLGTTLF